MKKMNSYRAKDLQRSIQVSIDYLTEIMKSVERISTRLHRDQSDGFPPKTSDSQSGGRDYNRDGSISGPTPALAFCEDPVMTLTNKMIKGLNAIEVEARTVAVVSRAICGLDHATAQRLNEAETPNGSNCVNCDEWLPGTGYHRAKAGRCPACYMYRLRHDGKDRPLKDAE